MKLATKTVFGALAVAGSVMAVSAPASAQGYYGGYDSGGYADPNYGPDPYYGGDPSYGSDPSYGPDPYYDSYGSYDSAYGDPYACTYYDYYNPPWGYPPDYCNYQVWTQPVYYGGLWYGGPIYYRSFGGLNWFWLNGSWRRDEWRGARPGFIDWSRNRYWGGAINHRPNSRGVWNGRQWDGRNGFTGGNFNRANSSGRPDNRGNFQGRGFNGGNAFAGRNWNGNGQNFGAPSQSNSGGGFQGGGGFRGRDFANRNSGQNFVAPPQTGAPPQNNDGGRGNFRDGGFQGRTGGDFANRGGGPGFVQPNNAAPSAGGNPYANTGRFFGRAGEGPAGAFQQNNVPGNSAVAGRFAGRGFQPGPQASGPQGGGFRGGVQAGAPQGGGSRGVVQGGGNRGGDQGGNRGRRNRG